MDREGHYLTEALRCIATLFPTQAILKGGTSLAKGWQLLDRVSEDIDLFVDPYAFPLPGGQTEPSRHAIDRRFRDLCDALAGHPALRHEHVGTIGGFGRKDLFHYESVVAGPQEVRAAVLVEAGIQSGREPTETRPVRSLISEFLARSGQGAIATDIDPFDMRLLHFRRTFVEKMFALHGKVERFRKEPAKRIGRDARHYADLYVLAGRVEVTEMLRSSEYALIRRDYDEKSRRFYPSSYRPPPDLSFRDSPALFPDAALRAELERDYDRDVSVLFFAGRFPPFNDVLARLEALRGLL